MDELRINKNNPQRHSHRLSYDNNNIYNYNNNNNYNNYNNNEE